METCMRLPNVRASRGFTLLEVLIALLIFSLGLLGLAGLMVVSVKTNQSAYLRTQASFLAQSMADRMRANTAVINDYNGDYSESTEGDSICEDTACAPAQLVENDRAVWSRQLITFLPRNAVANIQCDGDTLGTPSTAGAATYDGLCNFTITWSEARLEQAADGDVAVPQVFAWVFQP
jgi:type IV pilus assembly protein PilV